MTLGRKYGEAMDRIEVTPEMRQRILDNIQSMELSRTSPKVIRFPAWKRFTAMAACLVLVLAGAIALPRLLPHDAAEPPDVIASGFLGAGSLEELSGNVGYPVEGLAALPFAVEETEYASMDDMAEIRYTGEGQEAVYRKAPGTGDVSGDYNTYADEAVAELGGHSVTLKGENGAYTLAVWTDGVYSYAVTLTSGAAEAEWAAILSGHPELDALRTEAADRLCAAAYIGYVEGNTVAAVRQCVRDSGYGEKFPFLAEIPEERMVLLGGCDVYCVVPVDTASKVAVMPVEYDEEGAEVIKEAVYTGDSAPILLVCNVSDIMPNSLVTVIAPEGELSFSPYISLKDGSFSATAPEGTVYDFTPLCWPLDPTAAAYYDLFRADPALVTLIGLREGADDGFTDDQLSAYALTALAVEGRYDYETGLTKEELNAVAQKHFGRDIQNFENSMTTVLDNGRVTATGWDFNWGVFLVLDGQPRGQDGVITARFRCYSLSDSVWLDGEIGQSKLDHIREYLLTGKDEDFPTPLPAELSFEIIQKGRTQYIRYHSVKLSDLSA